MSHIKARVEALRELVDKAGIDWNSFPACAPGIMRAQSR